jgi:hypothetical protein
MIMLLIVVLGGVVGAAIQHYSPKVMTSRVASETIFEQIDSVRENLRQEAQLLVSAGGEARAAQSGAAVVGDAAAAVIVEVERAERDRLEAFYNSEVLPALTAPRNRSLALNDGTKARGLFDDLRSTLPEELHEMVDSLQTIARENRHMMRQARLHYWMHVWLLVHVPLSCALLLLGLIHAIFALRYI